jgi:hypothetical protein
MGYDLHITRATDWTESESSPITLGEWTAYVDNDPEILMDGAAEVNSPTGDAIRYENEGLAVWIAHSQHEDGGNKAWFDFRTSRIDVKNLDVEITRKMHRVAAALNAGVQGDDSEWYDATGNAIEDEADAPDSGNPLPWWKRVVAVLTGGGAAPAEEAALEGDTPSFSPGDRVKDAWDNLATIVFVDATANGGLGEVRVQYDDGREQTVALVASGLEPVNAE